MRAALIGLVLAGVAAAQDPATPVPAAPLPKAPTRAEFRVGGFFVSGERSYDLSGVKTASGSIKGVEVLLRGRAAGLYVRSLSGTFGNHPQVISADARLLLFPPVFTVHLGAGRRALSSELGTFRRDFGMAGVSSTVSIGGSGLRTHIAVSAVSSPDKSAASSGSATNAVKNASTGLEGEAAVYFRLPKTPLFLSLGYRTEVFTSKSSSLETPEEVRGIRLGGGLQFGGH